MQTDGCRMNISCFSGLSAVAPPTCMAAPFLIQFPPRIGLVKLPTPTMKLLRRWLFYRVSKGEEKAKKRQKKEKSNGVWRCCWLSREVAAGVLRSEHMKRKEGKQIPMRKRPRNYLFSRHICLLESRYFFELKGTTRVEKAEVIAGLAELQLSPASYWSCLSSWGISPEKSSASPISHFIPSTLGGTWLPRLRFSGCQQRREMPLRNDCLWPPP